MAGEQMKQASHIIEILGFISAMTCVLVLAIVCGETAQQATDTLVLITGSLG